MRQRLALLLTVPLGLAGASPVDASEATLERASDPSPSVALGASVGTTLGGIAAGLGMAINAGPSNSMTAAGVTLASLAFVVGPSAGHIYAGETRHAVGFSLARAGLGALSAGAIGAGIGIAVGCSMGSWWGESEEDEDSGDCDAAAGPLMFVGGLIGAGALGLAIYDIVDAPRAARRIQARNGPRISLAPAVSPGAYLLGVVGTF